MGVSVGTVKTLRFRRTTECPKAAVKWFREAGRRRCFCSQTSFFLSLAPSRGDEGKGAGGLSRRETRQREVAGE